MLKFFTVWNRYYYNDFVNWMSFLIFFKYLNVTGFNARFITFALVWQYLENGSCTEYNFTALTLWQKFYWIFIFIYLFFFFRAMRSIIIVVNLLYKTSNRIREFYEKYIFHKRMDKKKKKKRKIYVSYYPIWYLFIFIYRLFVLQISFIIFLCIIENKFQIFEFIECSTNLKFKNWKILTIILFVSIEIFSESNKILI